MSLDPVTALLDIGNTVIGRIFPDPLQAATAKLELVKLQQSGELAAMTGQLEINKVEAGSTSTFVSGWRPMVGWVCATACAWNWIGLSVVKVVVITLGYKLELSPANLTEMMPVLMGMLGIGTLRTIEKINGVAAK